MRKKIFIFGGVRSGKSSYAVQLGVDSAKQVTFIATCTSQDEEMLLRIYNHKKSRPAEWTIIEDGMDIGSKLSLINDENAIVIVDCLGFWVSNLLLSGLDDIDIIKEIDNFVIIISRISYSLITVSNEVGCGLVPETILGRRFRDLLGYANQKIASVSEEVFFMLAGIPLKIK